MKKSSIKKVTPSQWWALGGFLLVVVVVALIGGLSAGTASNEYQFLNQPAWAPPAWVFGPVWTLLYFLIAVAGWLVWRKIGFGVALWVYTFQLILNALWTPLFFGADRYDFALADIALLWVAIGATILLFWRASRLGAWLLVPYWAWVTFATVLNFAIWQMN